MKRELIQNKTGPFCDCCPGHDSWPNNRYKSRRSQKARNRHIKKEHQFVRSIVKRNLKQLQIEALDTQD